MRFDIKTIIIIILSIITLYLSFNKGYIGDNPIIKKLHDSNDSLNIENDSLYKLIDTLNVKITTTVTQLNINDSLINESENKIKKLKDENEKINIRIRNMSASNVADALTDYIKTRAKHKSCNR